MPSTSSTTPTQQPDAGAGPDRWPTVSVIVPTRNRAPYLRMLLNALAIQVYPAARVEVIVIDNSSTDETESVLREAAGSSPFALRYVRKEDEGPAAARNLGASMATGEILAFTDSDCIPAPGWLRSAVAGFAEDVGVACGPVVPVGITRDSPFFMHQIHPVTYEDGLYPTANAFYRRSAFLDLGGFDEGFRTYSWGQPVGGDDTDLAWRVRRHGYRSVFARDACVYHQATPVSARGYLLQTVAARVLPRLVVTIPELRQTCLYRRFFLHGRSASFYPFITGLALSRVTRWSLLLAVPWLKATWPALKIDAWPPRRWPRAAFRLLLEIESSSLLAMALVQGSIRHRRIVL